MHGNDCQILPQETAEKKIIPAWGNTCNSKKTKIPH